MDRDCDLSFLWGSGEGSQCSQVAKQGLSQIKAVAGFSSTAFSQRVTRDEVGKGSPTLGGSASDMSGD